jgi:hypothetical protein
VRVEITVAGYSADWEFPGSQGFVTWARERPWLSSAAMCVIQTAAGFPVDMLYASACQTIRGLHGDARPLRTRRVECGASSGSPVSAVLSALEVDPQLSPFEAKGALIARLTDRPTVVFVSAVADVPSFQWYELAVLVEHYAKSSPIVPLCVVAIDQHGSIQHQPSFDFVSGRATHVVLPTSRELEESIVWSAYLHHRACWDAGGNPESALEIGDRLSTALRGDDNEVERLLTEWANETGTVRGLQDLLPFVLTAMARYPSDARESARETLHHSGFTWRRPGSTRLEVVPWVCRFYLGSKGAPEALIPTLRYNLVCNPIATEILTHCFDAEARIRMQIAGRQVEAVSDTTSLQRQRFIRGEEEYVIYPPAYPLAPTRSQDVWAFASLGEALRACPSAAVSDRFWETVRLRNALAHGHYVVWAHVKLAIQQARRFDN